MKKAGKIRFDMSDDIDSILSDELVIIDKNCYTRTTNATRGSLRFAVPRQIIDNLDLQAGDPCFFCRYSEGFYLSFKIQPEAATKAQIKQRNLVAQGQANTIYLVIPPFIKNLYNAPITAVQLMQIKGFQPHEWSIRFLTTDSI
jgi:hypothetical protein